MIQLNTISVLFFVLVQFFSTVGFSGSLTTADTTKDTVYQMGTYNIRYAAQEDELTGNGWNKRKAYLINIIKDHDMDIVGTQEGDDQQLRDMEMQLSGYAYFKIPYGSEQGSHNAAIFYKSSLFKIIDKGYFWLSETPDVKSKGWDASDYRIAQWIKFQDRLSGKDFFVFNTHFYWRKYVAKEKSAALIAERIREIAGDTAVICMGDLNSLPDSKAITSLETRLVDSYKSSPIHKNQVVGTGFAGGVFTGISDHRIDYLFTSKNIKVHSYEVIDTTYDEHRYPSDHLPVVIAVSMP